MPRLYRYMSNPALYDLFALNSPELLKKQKFFLDATKDFDHVLEIGAGTGNVALYLADHGKRVTCVEPSPNVLIALGQKVFPTVKYKDLISILPVHAQNVPDNLRFDCIIIPNVIQLIPAEGVRKTFVDKLRTLLRPNGKLVITFFGEGRYVKQPKVMDAERKVGDVTYRRFTSCSPFGSVSKKQVKVSWLFESTFEGRVIQTHHDDFLCRCDTLESATKMLKDFKIDHVWTDYDRTKWVNGNEPKEFVIEGRARKV